MVAAAVRFEVIADLGMLGKADVPVDDGPPDLGMPADVDVVVDDGGVDLAEAVDANVVANQAVFDATPERMEPWATMESSATPMRSSSAKTNLAGGY